MKFVQLSTIANANLGYKSLQNDFFYVNQATIDSFGIEQQYLTPLLMLRDMDAGTFFQKAVPSLWLFNCKAKTSDIRGTGALRYIEAMANRRAAEKKQTGKSLTIAEVLQAQGGGLWYAPKAKPNKHYIWLRKAFNSTFAPFLFNTPALVDQRCNSISVLPAIEWKELAATLTSSLFAYSLEINGSASMGAGALEAPTTKLRSYPIFDITQSKPADRKAFVALAEAVWTKETPIDWSASKVTPGDKLRELDDWILRASGSKIKVDTVYADIHEVCQSRLLVAKDKTKKTKKKQTDNIGNVADSIVESVRPQIQLKNFPDDFATISHYDLNFNINVSSVKSIILTQLFGEYDIEIIAVDGSTIYEATHPRPVAEAIVRSLLWGRSAFSVSSNRDVMESAVTQFLDWISKIESTINDAISESSLGTGYEEPLRREVYKRLSIHPLSGVKQLPMEIPFASST